MSKHAITRVAAILAGAAVLFVLQQRFEVSFYIALPAAIVAYLAVLVGMGLALGVTPPAK